MPSAAITATRLRQIWRPRRGQLSKFKGCARCGQREFVHRAVPKAGIPGLVWARRAPLMLMMRTPAVRIMRPIEEEMRGKSIAFTLQLAMMSDEARTLRTYLNELSGLAAMQLLAMTMRPEKPGRSALANLIQRAIQQTRY
eukprot:s534_g5.t1